LGRVCPKFCERVCRRGQFDEPVSICSLKRFPADKDRDSDSSFLPKTKPATGKRIAIVGAGIVGLTAAYYLRIEGHECVLYEARERPGGALDFIIPEFRLPKDVLGQEIERVLELGAKLECGKKLGRDFTLEDLHETFDAVLLATGATHEKLPTFPGSEHAESGLHLLDWVATGNPPHVHGAAAVIGSGPTALDTSRTLLRLGAEEVTLLMEPSIDASLFFKTWIPDGLEEGIRILDRADRYQIGKLHDDKFRVHFRREERDETMEADHVFLAGQVEPDLEFLQNLGLQTTRQGVRVDRRTLLTNLEGVFAAGNIAQAGRYAVQGSAAGKQAASAISQFLSEVQTRAPEPIDVRMPHLTDRELEILFAGLYETRAGKPERIQYNGSVKGFDEVLSGFRHDDAVREAERCLQCDCAAKNDCALREVSTAHGASPKAFEGAKPCFERDTSHEAILYESGKCIKCGRCIAIAEEAGEELGLTYIGRGFQVKVGVPFSKGIAKGLAQTALACAEACPTGALAAKRPRGDE
jgi:formate dehydrogenase major subunit